MLDLTHVTLALAISAPAAAEPASPTAAEAPDASGAADPAPAEAAPTEAAAAEPAPAAAASGSVALGAEGPTAAGRASRSRADRPKLSGREDVPWIRRWAPERNMGEVGLYGGALFPSDRIELFEPDASLPNQGQKPFGTAFGHIGLRGAYFPIRFVGVEAEVGVLPGGTEAGDSVLGWTARGHVIGQLALWSVVPFAVVGGGALGVASDRDAVGNDVDQSLHWGFGAKVFINRWLMVRLDIRDVIAPRRGIESGASNNWEVLTGVGITLGRKKDEPNRAPAPAPAPAIDDDRDDDGYVDDIDKCPDVAGVSPDGCPAQDSDGDGVLDDVDECPQEPGDPPSGCPAKDSDGDGFVDSADTCPDQPETVNDYEDTDGCPDEVPAALQAFGGTIEGITFATAKATIRKSSFPTLDQAAKVLAEYPTVRVEVSGHSDSTGNRDFNVSLSQARAQAVKDYLVGKGIDAGRIEVRGAGPDEPIDSNATEAGRAKNRRIEFRLLR